MEFYQLCSVLVALCLFGSDGQFLGPSSTNDYCYPGFTRHGATCYRYVNFAARWAEAWTFCSAMSAHLVSIETSDENAILTEMIRNYTKGSNETGIKKTWTSGTNLQGSLLWQNTRAPVTYTSWAVAEPYVYSPDEIYCIMKYQDVWYADICTHERRFVCEAEIDGLVTTVVHGGKLDNKPGATIG